MPNASDKNWLLKLFDKHSSNKQFKKPRTSQTSFTVLHFADQVVHSSIHSFFKSSIHPFIFQFIHFFILQFIRLLIYYAFHRFIHASSISSSFNSSVYSSIMLFIDSSMHHPFFYCSINLSIYSFIHTFFTHS